MRLDQAELAALCERVTTWDRAELGSLLGERAINYALAHDRDVRRLAREMCAVFPLSPAWWKIGHALKNVFDKNDAIRERAAQIAEDRKAGRIVERFGALVYVETGK